MKHRIKNLSRGGYILVGFVVAMLLVPSGMAVGAALKYTGIGGAGGRKALVVHSALQVIAPPSVGVGQVNPGSSWTKVIDGNTAANVTSINVDTWSVTPGGNSAIQLAVSYDSCASVGQAIEAINPGGIGETSLNLGSAGIALIPGEELCAINDDPAHLSAAVFALYN